MKRILQAMDGISTKPVEGANDMKKFLQVVTEGSNPHKVSLPVQMAMQHYAKETPVAESKPEPKRPNLNSKLYQYYQTVEQEIEESQQAEKELISEQARTIAQRIREKSNMGEMAIAHNKERVHNPTVHSHLGANAHPLMDLIDQATADLVRITESAKSLTNESSDEHKLLVWQNLVKEFGKPGIFQNLAGRAEQIRHGIQELAIAKHSGKGIDPKLRGQVSQYLDRDE